MTKKEIASLFIPGDRWHMYTRIVATGVTSREGDFTILAVIKQTIHIRFDSSPKLISADGALVLNRYIHVLSQGADYLNYSIDNGRYDVSLRKLTASIDY